MLQLSDLHVDLLYSPHTEAECKLPVCCRQNEQKKRYGHILESGYWGTVGKCDVPYWTIKHMLQHIAKTEKLDYILISGDLINHVDWKYSMDTHIATFRNLSALVKETFPSTPTYWAIGNHEGVPVNSFAPHSVSNRFWPTWLYEEFQAMNEPWIKNEDDITKRGSFSTLIKDNLRLISINTGFCINTNFFIYLNQSDPDGTFTWFIQELLKAEKAGENVQIVAHIPPGSSDCLEGWAYNYYKIIQRFYSIIVGQFFGHVHYDYFSIFYKDEGNVSSQPISTLYASPSVSTFDYLNPAYRIYTIDPQDNYKVQDYDSYYADVSTITQKDEPQWKILYSAKEAYNMTDLSPQSWNIVADRIFNNPRTHEQFFRIIPNFSFKATTGVVEHKLYPYRETLEAKERKK